MKLDVDLTKLTPESLPMIAPLLGKTVEELTAEIEVQRTADQRAADIKTVKDMADDIARTFTNKLELEDLKTQRYLDIRIAFFVDIDKEGDVRYSDDGRCWIAETRVKDLTRKAGNDNGYQRARNGDGGNGATKRDVGDMIPTSSTNYKRICLVNYLLTRWRV